MQSDVFHRWEDLQALDNPGQMLSSLPPQQVQVMLERPCSSTIPCLTHRNLCRVGRGDIDVDVTGTPCQDHSPCGNRLGCHGPRHSIFKGYCQTMRHLQPRIIIHENVCQFPASFLADALSDIYVFFSDLCGCKSCGNDSDFPAEVLRDWFSSNENMSDYRPFSNVCFVCRTDQ